MGNSPTRPTLIRGSNNTNNSTTNAGVNASNIMLYTNSLRNNLISRNLYTPNDIYPTSEKRSAQNVINSVGSIINTIAPFKSFSLSDSLFGRALGVPTPLTTISTALLGKQLAYNSMSHLAQQVFPTIKIANLFDGSKNTHLFTPKINFSITTRSGNGFMRFLSATINTYTTALYPFTKTTTNADIIANSGTGQLSFLFQAMNQNIYKEGFDEYSPTDLMLQQKSTEAQFPITLRGNIIGSGDYPLNKYTAYFDYLYYNPYTPFRTHFASITAANGEMVTAMNSPVDGTSPTQEYAPNADFVRLNFGKTNDSFEYKFSESSNDWVYEGNEFRSDYFQNALIWGNDGISSRANANINELRGTFKSNDIAENHIPKTVYNIYSGLLEYTRNLLNASEGAVVDITRKAFTKNKNVVGFNGSALWIGNNSYYSQRSGFADKTGVRQHSVLDQYGKFAKSIRFNGNATYQGNENSVLFNSVLPRITPTINKENAQVDNKNLMFSLENLAVRVISKSNVGIIDDEYGSAIPITEVGQFNGRLMWFPPYDISINESTSAKYDSTTMVGRNEPIYSYMYSERSATLTFTLLVDYPSNLKSINFKGPNKHKAIAEFFAFGGDPYQQLTSGEDVTKVINTIQQQIVNIGGAVPKAQPEVTKPIEVKAYFPNAFPTEAQKLKAFDILYNYPNKYRIVLNCVVGDGFNFNPIAGIINNGAIFVKKGLTGKASEPLYLIGPNTRMLNPYRLQLRETPSGFSQYTAIDENDDYGGCQLNKNLKTVFGTPDNSKYWQIDIVGSATSPDSAENNKALGQRRADAVKELILKRLAAMKIDSKNIVINTTSIGETQATGGDYVPGVIGHDAESDDNVAQRYASINFNKKTLPPEKTTNQPSVNDLKAKNQLDEDISSFNRSKNQSSNLASENTMVDRNIDDNAILDSFKSISNNNFYPVFHSQTPEEFHRRLTFLQQCMRQGAAKRYDVPDENGNLVAKNSVFGRQPICILRIGDFLFSKVIIENLSIDYSDAPWDMNPEGFGMQPMMAKVTLQMKVIGGQSLKGPVDALQNAVSFNYYANSSFVKGGMYFRPSAEADKQASYNDNILTTETEKLDTAFSALRTSEKNIEAQNTPTTKTS